jgi:NAD(P)-dependent dehydrogenase (short-subunit alcohol dehydrogenase family)
MSPGLLEGKTALVTGAGSTIGFGRVMTLALVSEGARVVMMDVKEDELAQSARDAREIGGMDCVLPLTADISSPPDAERAVQAVVERFGAIDVLINNAGIGATTGFRGGRGIHFWDIPPDAWDRIISVNLSGAFYMARAAVPRMIARGWGRLIGVTTSLDTMIRAHGAPYGPSKAGHEAFMSSAAYELAGTGVTANILVPGGSANTNLGDNAATRSAEDSARLIQPEVMGPPAVWLASEESNDFNGMRLTAIHWDQSLPIVERLEKASMPIAWRQLAEAIAAQRAQVGLVSNTRNT